MANRNKKIIIFSQDEELKTCLERYFKYSDTNKIELVLVKDLRRLIAETKNINTQSLIVIDDFYTDFNDYKKLGGLPTLKRLRSLWFPHYTDSQNKEKVYIIPVLFLCADEIWRLEVAILRAGYPENFGENEGFFYHLNFLKATFFLKIPFLLAKFREIVRLSLKCRFETDIAKMKLLAAAMGYEEHHGHK